MINFSDVEHVLKETISILNQDLDKLFEFAYELRRQDKNHGNHHTSMLLNGNVRPPVLANIILANYWDEDEKRMKCDYGKRFRLALAESGNPIVYLRNYFKNLTEKPIIQRQMPDGSLSGGNGYIDEVHLLLQPKGGI